MSPDSVLGGFGAVIDFLGQVITTWMPAAIVTFGNTIGSPVATSSPWAMTANPLAATDFPGFLQQTASPETYSHIVEGWKIFSVITFAVSIPFLVIAAYGTLRIVQVRRKERHAFEAAQRTVVSEDMPRTQLRWNHVLEQANSDSPEHQRLAILEADIMLNELLDLQGYRGETIADKMKQVDRANFNSIDLAWQAHKVRNDIAHKGTEHPISSRQVRDTIDMYEKVLKEFKYIE